MDLVIFSYFRPDTSVLRPLLALFRLFWSWDMMFEQRLWLQVMLCGLEAIMIFFWDKKQLWRHDCAIWKLPMGLNIMFALIYARNHCIIWLHHFVQAVGTCWEDCYEAPLAWYAWSKGYFYIQYLLKWLLCSKLVKVCISNGVMMHWWGDLNVKVHSMVLEAAWYLHDSCGVFLFNKTWLKWFLERSRMMSVPLANVMMP